MHVAGRPGTPVRHIIVDPSELPHTACKFGTKASSYARAWDVVFSPASAQDSCMACRSGAAGGQASGCCACTAISRITHAQWRQYDGKYELEYVAACQGHLAQIAPAAEG
jgi:hypothetical protein